MAVLAFRKAALTDLAFIIRAVKAAERLGTCEASGSTYEKLFILSSTEVDALLDQALTIESSGYQLTLSTFYVCTQDEVPVACCSAWVEAADGVASGFKIASVLSEFVGLDKWIDAKAAIKAFSNASPQRTPGSLQMETFFVEPDCRGQGLTSKIIADVTRLFHSALLSPKIAEITLLERNSEALRAYEKAGFHIYRKGAPGNPLFKELTGSVGFIQLRMALET